MTTTFPKKPSNKGKTIISIKQKCIQTKLLISIIIRIFIRKNIMTFIPFTIFCIMIHCQDIPIIPIVFMNSFFAITKFSP